MKTGRISENILKRSVLRQIKTKRDEVTLGAGIGDLCALFSFRERDGNCLVAAAQAMADRADVRTAGYAVYEAANHLAAAGREPVAALVSVLLPEEAQEAALKEIVAGLEEACVGLQIQLSGFQASVNSAVNWPVVTVTAIGRGCSLLSEKSEQRGNTVKQRPRPGQDLVVSKWIGLEGTAVIARKREKELRMKYPVRFLEEAKELDRFLSVVPEAATAMKSGACAMHNVTEGGIFGALWEMAEGAGVGLEIYLKKIPVKQETIEICEFFELNPYELKSGGCLLMAADNGYDLVRELETQNIPAAVIGKVMGGNDRVVINEEERRFLERSKPDELYKIYEKSCEGGTEER